VGTAVKAGEAKLKQPHRVLIFLAGFPALALLILFACSDGSPEGTAPTEGTATPAPTPVYDGPGERLTIQSTTQAHLQGVAIAAGNIWEEEYTTASGVKQRGLTAMLFISVENDPSRNQALRVHPGQELSIPGYHLNVLLVEERYVHLAVIELPR
jgi:hypothetical protein